MTRVLVDHKVIGIQYATTSGMRTTLEWAVMLFGGMFSAYLLPRAGAMDWRHVRKGGLTLI
jgi:hypothetical protein